MPTITSSENHCSKVVQYPIVLFLFAGRLAASSGLSLFGIVDTLKKLDIHTDTVQKGLGYTAMIASGFITARTFLPSINKQVAKLISTDPANTQSVVVVRRDGYWLIGLIPKTLAYGSMAYSTLMAYAGTHKMTNHFRTDRQPHWHDYNELEYWQTAIASYVALSSIACYKTFTLPRVHAKIDDAMTALRDKIKSVRTFTHLKDVVSRENTAILLSLAFCSLGVTGYNAGGYYSIGRAIKFIPSLYQWTEKVIVDYSIVTGVSTSIFSGVASTYSLILKFINLITQSRTRNSTASHHDKKYYQKLKNYLMTFDKDKLIFLIDLFLSLPMGVTNILFNSLPNFLGMLGLISSLNSNNFLPFPAIIVIVSFIVLSTSAQAFLFNVWEPLGIGMSTAETSSSLQFEDVTDEEQTSVLTIDVSDKEPLNGTDLNPDNIDRNPALIISTEISPAQALSVYGAFPVIRQRTPHPDHRPSKSQQHISKS